MRLTKAHILHAFTREKSRESDLRLGLEVECSGVNSQTLEPLPYAGSRGYLEVYKRLCSEAGWEPVKTDDKGNIFSLHRADTYVHTEGDGRPELASRPRLRLRPLLAELRMHTHTLATIGREFLGARFLYLGAQPLLPLRKFPPWVPQKRYRFIAGCGAMPPESAPQWRRYNFLFNGLHLNFGYTDEADAAKKSQALYRAAPILGAMFASSPMLAGKFSGFFDARLHAVRRMIPSRSGFLPVFFDGKFSFERHLDFVLSLPTFYVARQGEYIDLRGQTFGDFLNNGCVHSGKKIYPTMEDFWLHTKSVWGEIRLKNYLEFRTLDAVPPFLIPSAVALLRGLMMSKTSVRALAALTKGWTRETYLQALGDTEKHALGASIGGVRVSRLAAEVLEIATSGLREMHRSRKTRTDNTRELWPLKHFCLVREQSPAEFMMEMWEGPWRRDPHRLVEFAGAEQMPVHA